MRLRRALERHLAVEPGEKRLSAGAADLVFRGMYAGRTYDSVEPQRNHRESTQTAYPYSYRVVRTWADGTKSFANDNLEATTFRTPLTTKLDELNDPLVAARVRRVERTASRLKLYAASFLGLVAAGTMAAVLISPDAAPSQAPELPNCAERIDSNDVLVPAAQAGQQADCELNGYPYAIIE